MDNTDNGVGPEWDDMIETIMDSIPVKLSNSEGKSVRNAIRDLIWAYVGDIFSRSSIEFHKSREGNAEVRLWMSIGQERVDFQKGFDTKEVIADSYSIEGLQLTCDVLTARIEEMQREGCP